MVAKEKGFCDRGIVDREICMTVTELTGIEFKKF